MYFWPGFKTFLFGDGRYVGVTGIGYYMRTDVGVMRAMLFYGIFGEIIGYLVPAIIIIGIAKTYKYSVSRESTVLLCLLLFIQMFFFELKGDPFFYTLTFILPLLLSADVNREEMKLFWSSIKK
ncbi:hypothetical protein FACS189490_04410 [Clostridia bacterium]|nr:hypothetical protein FACS189490_04410 [Clostridia bacterium]